MSVLTETLSAGAAELGIELPEKKLILFEKYYAMIIQTNQNINLTAIVEERDVAVKHFTDALTCLKAAPFDAAMSVLDVGSGAGIPGIPLKICRPDLKITLIDSLDKRVKFLKSAIKGLGLEEIEAFHKRIEDLGRNKEYRGRYDRVLARAVANLGVLAEYCLPPLKKGGLFLAMKGPLPAEEIKNAEKAITILGGVVERTVLLRLPITGEERSLVVIRKIKDTPAKYPRRAGIPSKKPL
ncbi:16S rRNA (guanine(527)-N(7))-methyltransferase RsmG [Pelotomaculum propionicicum]|uniref:Ribosomal RNA small subunit methyltransferase G n=1 Tax=Pelotomaculum propionicicum TaxID=258475 RepID=A0A4Y7RXI2_9FIRM|nr:16S rRNA (guanine(527)-N(7))-methyltransferase RsmG [Pelotomaculum propionicicum]NLI14535.1 16S rRNA (guanine(527)-N(7))-methyltransferase RsmG [Peptococcaceae bacterium]TEB13705.1 Ribosomal RNA small subunit methyltransferase G [Pelotomaculum propionicicum]